jgi:aspartyl-tRNA(Asn)/glutamyl-tRNA(Gln) amidotransferase subunit A
MSLTQETILSLRQKLQNREVSAKDVIHDLVKKLEQEQSALGAYLSWDADKALAEAEHCDLNLPLGGIPVGIKDNINVLGDPCSCASKLLSKNYRSTYDATCIQQLRSAGALPFGRLNMDEFAMGSSTENSALGVTRNPHDLTRIPGGSSGGSAAAIAAHHAIAALGSDTGGSIRQPAAYCGCVGLKPTYGRVSRYGLVAFASSLDQIGVLTKDVADAAYLLEWITGKDKMDSTSMNHPKPLYTDFQSSKNRPFRVGVPKEYFGQGLDTEIGSKVRQMLTMLEEQKIECVEVSLPHTELAVSTYYIIAPAEASGNLARFDGVRYGARSESIDQLADVYYNTRSEGFGAEVKRRILLGTYVLSSGYYDAYYRKAQCARTLISQDFEKVFQEVDLLISPSAPSTAHPLGKLSGDPLSAYLEDVYTIPANLAGLPAINVPIAYSQGEKKLPIGIQLIGKPFDETRLLAAASLVESLANFQPLQKI